MKNSIKLFGGLAVLVAEGVFVGWRLSRPPAANIAPDNSPPPLSVDYQYLSNQQELPLPLMVADLDTNIPGSDRFWIAPTNVSLPSSPSLGQKQVMPMILVDESMKAYGTNIVEVGYTTNGDWQIIKTNEQIGIF